MSNLAMGNDARKRVLPSKEASGPGYLGPAYSPADEMLAPAQIGVRRDNSLESVIGAVKGVAYYADMMGFGESSSGFTRGMPGLRPLGVNYFLHTGGICSNGAEMWEYVQTIPTGGALGNKIKLAMREMGLPQLRGMAPGILEDAQAALNPSPVINAVVGSGLPQCRLMRLPVGDIDGKITNVDGNLIVDPGQIIKSEGRYFQEKWVQDRDPVAARSGESSVETFMRGNPIQLGYDEWNAVPKLYKEDGCLKDEKSAGNIQPYFCSKAKTATQVSLPDGTVMYSVEGFESYDKLKQKKTPHAIVSLSVAVIAVMSLLAYWNVKKR